MHAHMYTYTSIAIAWGRRKGKRMAQWCTNYEKTQFFIKFSNHKTAPKLINIRLLLVEMLTFDGVPLKINPQDTFSHE